MTEATNCWRIGDVKVTRIVELEMPGIDPAMILAGVSADDVRRFRWLQPHYADGDGQLIVSIHAFVVESRGKRILVDTCVGNDKQRNLPVFHLLNTPFLARLGEAGYAPSDIDLVLCTHMHVDHVGWNTMLVDGRWVPTFPNARYLFARQEWGHWRAEDPSLGDVTPESSHIVLSPDNVMRDSIQPIIDAGLHELVDEDHRLTDEVWLTPTPGHTPGHVSLWIRSGESEAVITGDVMHHPLQIADPDIGSLTDFEGRQARETRFALLKSCACKGAIVFGTHFATPAAGRIVGPEGDWRLESHVAAFSLAKA